MPSVRTNGIDIAYEVTGSGPAIVLAHGYLATSSMWAGQVGPLSQRYRVLVYDARGHGKSSAPPVEDRGYVMENLVADQKGLMDHLGIDKAIIGGLSMGGMIAMRFALQHPGAVRALLICDTSAGMGLEGQFTSNRLLLEAWVRSQGVKPLLRSFYARSAGSARLPSQADLPAGVQSFINGLDGMSADGFLGMARAAADAPSVLGRLSEIEKPALIVTGDRDFFRGASEEMHARMPGSRLALIRNAAHGTCVWQPAAFTRAVIEFLDDADAGRPVAGERTY
jgi:3-oxoadipate enol-lactonase